MVPPSPGAASAAAPGRAPGRTPHRSPDSSGGPAVRTPPPGRRPARRLATRRSPSGRGRRAEPWLYLIPAAVVLAALLVYPLYQLVVMSLYDYRQAQVSGNAPLEFTGLANYVDLLTQSQFWGVLGNTIVFAGGCVIASLAVGGALAVLATRLRRWVRTTLFVVALGAWATPAMTGSAVWMFLFDPTLGLVNKVLANLGLAGFQGHSWTYDKWSAFALVAAEVVWCSFPFVMVTLYAGIISIPTELIEAARLDGATTLRIARSVIAPLLRPLLLIVTIQSIIWDFKVFTQIYVMTSGGGIAGQNLVLNVYSYQQAFAASLYGKGAAIGVVMTLILLAITLLYLRAQRREGDLT